MNSIKTTMKKWQLAVLSLLIVLATLFGVLVWKMSEKAPFTRNVSAATAADYGLEMAEGASIRIVDYTGIRFSASIAKDGVEDVTEYGIIMSDEETLNGAELTVANAKGKIFDKTSTAEAEMATTEKNGRICFNAVLTNIKDQNLTRTYVARAYVKIGEDTETTKATYSYTDMESRSPYAVAQAAYNDGYTDQAIKDYMALDLTVDANGNVAIARNYGTIEGRNVTASGTLDLSEIDLSKISFTGECYALVINGKRVTLSDAENEDAVSTVVIGNKNYIVNAQLSESATGGSLSGAAEAMADKDTNVSPTHVNFSAKYITLGTSTTTKSSLGMEEDGTTYLKVEITDSSSWWNGSVVNFTDERENTNLKQNGTYTKVKIRYKLVGNTNPEGLFFRILGKDGGDTDVNTCPSGYTDGYINLAPEGTEKNSWIEAEFAIVYANPQYITGLDFGVRGYAPTIYIDYIEFINASEGAGCQHTYVYKTDADGHTPTCSQCQATLATVAHSGGKATCIKKAKCEECGAEYGDYGEHTGATASCAGGVCEDCGKVYEANTEHTFDGYVCTGCGLNVVKAVFGAGVSITSFTSTDKEGTVAAGQDGSLVLDKDWWINLTLSGLIIPQNATAIKLTAKTGRGDLPQYAITGAAQNYTDQNIPLSTEYSDIIIPLTNGQGTELTMFNLIAGGWALSIKKVEFICVDANDVVNDVFGTTGASIAADPNRGNANSAIYGTNDGALAFGNSWWSQSTLTGVTIPTNATEVKMTLKYVQTAPGNGFTGNLIVNFGCGEYTIQPTAEYAEYTFTLTTGQGAAMPQMDFCVEEKGMVYLSKVEFTLLEDSDTRNDPVRLNFSEKNFTLGEGTKTSSSFGIENDGTTYLKVEVTEGSGTWNGAIVNFTDNRDNTNVKYNGTYATVKIRFKVTGNLNDSEKKLALSILGVDGAGTSTSTEPHGNADAYINLYTIISEKGQNVWIEQTYTIVNPYVQTVTGFTIGTAGYMPTIYIDYIEFLVENAHAHDFTYSNDGHTATCSCGSTYTTEHKGGTATCTEQAICSICRKAYGELAGHTGGMATCLSKANCDVCGKAYGELAGHTGGTATCTKRAICSVCNHTYGDLAAHTYENNVCTACGLDVVENVFGEDGVTITATGGNVAPAEDGSLAFSGAWWVDTTVSGLTIPANATAIKLTMRYEAGNGTPTSIWYNITGVQASGSYAEGLVPETEYTEYTIKLIGSQGSPLTTLNFTPEEKGTIYLLKVEFVTPEDPDTDMSATHLNFSEEHFTLGESTTATGSFGQETDGTTYLKIETQSVTPGEWDSSSRVYFTDNRENKNIKIDGDYTTVKIRFKVSGSYNPDCLRFRVLGYESVENQTLTQTHFVDLLPLTKAHGTDTWIEATIALEQAYVGIVTGLGFGVAGYTPTIYIDYIEFTSASLTVDGANKLVFGEMKDGGVLTSSVSVSDVAMTSHDDSLEITMKAALEKDYVFTITVDGVTRTQTVTVGTEYEAYLLALPKTGTAFTIAVEGEVIMKNIDFVDSSAKMAYWGPVLSMNGSELSDTDKANLDLYKDAGFNVFTITSPNSIGTPIGQEVSIENTPTKAVLDYGAENDVDIIVTDQVLQCLSHARIPLVANTGYALFQEKEGVGKVYFASGAVKGATVTALDGANVAHTVTVDDTATFQFASQTELNEFVYNRMKAYATHSAYYGVDLWDEPKQETFTAIGQLLDAIAYADGKLGVKTYPQQCLLPSYGFGNLGEFDSYVRAYAQMITTHGNGIISSLRSDVYPLRDGKVELGIFDYNGNYIQKDYIACIQTLAKIAKEYDLDWELTVQSYGHSDSAYRTVSENGLKWQVALAYAFGAKNVSYYTFTGDTHGGYDSAIVTGSYTEGYVSTDLYTYVQKATAYAEAIGDVLYDYAYNGSTMKAVNKSSERSSYSSYGYYYDSVSDDNVSGFAINSATYTTVLTQLKAADGKYAYGLVNMVDPDKSLTNSVKVTLNGVTSATVYKYSTDGTNNMAIETVEFTSGAYTFSLAAGEGIIILPA